MRWLSRVMLRLLIENTLDREVDGMKVWRECTLGDFITFQRGHDLPKSQMKEGQYPVVGSNGIIGFHNEYTTNEPSITIGRSGNVGKPFIYYGKTWSHNTSLYIKDYKNNDPIFVFYFLKTMDLANFAGGSAVPTLNRNHIHTLPVKVPTDVDVQKKIGYFLKLFDDKIEQNVKINNNLEQQAQVIFTNEFLMFDSLPEGWIKGSLLDIANYLNGLAMQKFRPSENEIGYPVLKIKELRQGCCDANSELCSPNIKQEYIVNDGDVIFSWSGSLLVDFWCGGTCGLNQHLFKVTSDKYDKWFFYAWTTHHLQKFIAIAADMATTMGHIKREELAKSEVLIPTAEDYSRIGELLSPIYDLIIANRIENKQLANLRDTLLPKLMSGELDISEVCYE